MWEEVHDDNINLLWPTDQRLDSCSPKMIDVELGSLIDPMIMIGCVESDSISICSDGPDQQRRVFDPKVAETIDQKLCYEDAISLVFLAVEKLEAAHEMAKNAEKNAVNQVWQKHGIMYILYQSLRNYKISSWTPIVHQSLYHIGYFDILQDHLEIDLDREQNGLEIASRITPIRRVLYELCEALDDIDQEVLFQQLKSRHGSLAEAKTMETVMLQLLIEVPREEICNLIKESIDAMQNVNLRDVFSRRSCGLESCSFHSEGANAVLDYFQSGPGMCIIINQKNFKKMSNFEDRLGSDRDKEELVLTFELLGALEIDVYDDLSDIEIRSKLEAAANKLNVDHKNFAWVSIIILSHGLMKNGEDAIVGVNGHSVLVDDIRDLFSANKIPEFQDKPKMFWFQACRVNESNESGASGYNYPGSYTPQTVSKDTAVPSVNQKPTLINQMVHSATIPKHNAYRSTLEGSFFIQNLCEVLQEHAADMTLDSMAKKVNRKVVGHNLQYQSMPEYKHTLTKEFKFEITEESKARFETNKRRNRYNESVI